MLAPMRRFLKLNAVLLAVLLLAAQLQGMAHGISHLGGRGAAHDLLAAHATVCADCVAFAQAGAAPVLVSPALALRVSDDVVARAPLPPRVSARPVASYRSRAPPASRT